MGILNLFKKNKSLKSVDESVILVDLAVEAREEPLDEDKLAASSEFDFDNCHEGDDDLDYGALDGPPLAASRPASAQRRRPKYGARGTVGPAPRFTWAETTCSDGTPLPYKYRPNAVRVAKVVNNLRIRVAKNLKVPVSDVYVTVNSWYRSPGWNKKSGGEPNSRHLVGNAMDINMYVKVKNGKKSRLKMISPRVVQATVETMPWANHCGCGKYEDFTHLDTRGYRARW